MNKGFTLETNGKLTAIRTPVTIATLDGKQMEFTALWDTGANRTYVSQRVAKELSLKPVEKATYYTASDTVTCDVYFIDMLLPGEIMMKGIYVFAFAGAPDCDVLIGMDVICGGDLAVTNAAGNTWVSFCSPPKKNHIDFKSMA